MLRHALLHHFPPEYAPDDSYEDLDSVNRSREGSVISLEWPYPYNEIRARSTNKQTITPMIERKPSNGPAHVMPPTQTLPPSSDRAKKPPFDITGAQLSQIKEIRASNLLAAYQPQSPTSRDIPHADESEYGMTIHHNSMTMSHLKSLKIKARLLKTGHLTNIQH